MSLNKIAKIFGVFAIIAVLCFALFVANNFFFYRIRGEYAFRAEKNALVENWYKNEKAIIALGDIINDNPVIIEFLNEEKEQYYVKVGKNYNDRTLIDFFEFNEYQEELGEEYIQFMDSLIENIDTISFLVYGTEDEILKSFENKPILTKKTLGSLKVLCEQVNVQGFWRDETNAINIQYSGNNFYGSFNYEFLKNEIPTEKVDSFTMLNDSIRFQFFETGLYCGVPIYIEN